MTMTFGYAHASGGARICYATEAGRGVPLLFVLHTGFPCASVISRYSGSLTLHRGIAGGGSWYMFDWRGTGKSTTTPGPVTFTDLVDDIEAVADAIGQPFDLNAVNDGCGMALAFATRRPEMVRRLLLVAPQGKFARSQEVIERTRRMSAADPVGALAQFLMWVHPGTDPTETFEIAERAFAAKPLEVSRSLRQAALDVDLLELAPSVLTPSLVLSAGGEVQDGLELAAQLPYARACNWTEIGDGTINGAAWRRAWDEAIPPNEDRESAIHWDITGSAALSPREAEILVLLCRGLSNLELAETLVIAPSTAKRHVANIFTKLGVSTRPQAIALAYERGLVPAPGRQGRG